MLSSSIYPYHPDFRTSSVPPNDYPSPFALPSPAYVRLLAHSSYAYCNEAEYDKTAVTLPPAVVVYHDTTVVEGQDISIKSSLASTTHTIVTF